MIFSKKKVIKRLDNRVSEYCYHELKKIYDMKNTQGLFNKKCFYNAVQYASKHKGCEVVMGFYKWCDSDHCSLHFWCKKGDNNYEVSVGYECEYFNYYEIKTIDKKDWVVIDTVFIEALDYYKHKFTTNWERIILGKERII